MLKVHRQRLLGWAASPRSPTERAGRAGAERRGSRCGGPRLGRLVDPPLGRPASTSRRRPETVAPGADLVAFSGDKLLGGPQAGIMVGRAGRGSPSGWKEPAEPGPGCDKLTLAALEATCGLDRRGRSGRGPDAPHAAGAGAGRGARGAAGRRRRIPGPSLPVVDGRGQVGGGTLPRSSSRRSALALGSLGHAPESLHARLRAPPPVGRIAGRAAAARLRTVGPTTDVTLVARAAAAALTGAGDATRRRDRRAHRPRQVVAGPALTGIDPDRLKEEKSEGSPSTSASRTGPSAGRGLTLGIVDVPGHEQFVKNMLAGVGGIDLRMLVVAADEGWMPQTRGAPPHPAVPGRDLAACRRPDRRSILADNPMLRCNAYSSVDLLGNALESSRHRGDVDGQAAGDSYESEVGTGWRC